MKDISIKKKQLKEKTHFDAWLLTRSPWENKAHLKTLSSSTLAWTMYDDTRALDKKQKEKSSLI